MVRIELNTSPVLLRLASGKLVIQSSEICLNNLYLVSIKILQVLVVTIDLIVVMLRKHARRQRVQHVKSGGKCEK